ncbi:MAG TPA: ABC transporter substrate-binding protein [Pseudolabrys sp.]|nr:ABC transporter substrate-binding protein [Pseudolabrys sp.]
MRRREFITLVGAAVAWPLAARAQQVERPRRIGVLIPFRESDPETQILLAAFKQRFRDLGWIEDRNVRFDHRYTDGNPEPTRVAAAELVALSPDVILAYANPAVSSLMLVTRTIPIVFTQASDPVGSGFVPNLAHPGGNITGFHAFEPAISGKWLEILKQIAPGVRRVAVVHHPNIAANVAFVRAAEAASPIFGVTVTAAGVRNPSDIERALEEFAREADGGLIVAPAPSTFDNRELITALAARLRLPAVYSYRFFVTSGGLASYSLEGKDLWRAAASYVDRILRGEKPGDLPVQLPTKYNLVINLNTAKALGITVPQTLLARAEEVIE